MPVITRDNQLLEKTLITPEQYGHLITANQTYYASGYSDLSDLLTAIGDKVSTIVVDAPIVVTADTTITDTCPNTSVVCQNPGKFTISSGITLTVDVPFTAGLYQVFDGDGSVVFGLGSVIEVYPEWWGVDGLDDHVQIQASLNSLPNGGKVKLSRSVYNVEASIFADSDTFDADWIIEGEGQATEITFSGSAFTADGLGNKYILYLNETSTGTEATGIDTYPGMRFTLRHMSVRRADGDTSEITSFAKAWQCGINMHDIRLDYVKYGLRTYGYCDLCKVTRCEVEHTVPNGYLYYQQQLGDGLVFEQNSMEPYTENSGMLYLRGAKNAQVRDNIQGRYVFIDCGNVLFANNHIETCHNVTEKVYINNSQVVLRDNTMWNFAKTGEPDTANTCVHIDDVTVVTAATRLGSHVYAENNRFYVTEPDNDPATVKANPEFKLDLSRETVLHLRNNRAAFHDGLLTMYDFGVTVDTSSATTDTTLANRVMYLSGDVIVCRGASNTHTVVNPNYQELFTAQAISSPAFSTAPVFVTQPVGAFSAATYYYTVSATNLFGQSDNATEQSITVGAGDVAKSVHFQFTNQSGCKIRMWRGTSAGVYDRYVELVSLDGDLRAFDRGTNVNGIPWITTGVPSVPSANEAYRGEYNAGATTLYGLTAAPTTGTWARGDRVYRLPSVGSPKSWVCTVAGTPGTWVSEGNL